MNKGDAPRLSKSASVTGKQDRRLSEHFPSEGRRFMYGAHWRLLDGPLAPHQRSYQSRRDGAMCDVGAFEVQEGSL